MRAWLRICAGDKGRAGARSPGWIPTHALRGSTPRRSSMTTPGHMGRGASANSDSYTIEFTASCYQRSTATAGFHLIEPGGQAVSATELLTVHQLAERLHIRPRTVQAWARKGRIPSVKLSAKVVRFD